MEPLLALLLCLLAVPAMVFLRSHARRARSQATIIVSDPAVARRALIENADDFSNRPAAVFPVYIATLTTGERNDNMTTADYGPRWRALRCNLAAGILHPSRLASLAPLQEEAARALVAGISSARGRGGGEAAVGIRGPVTTAAFALATRLCFGDMVDDGQRRAMGRVTRDSMVVVGEVGPRFDGSMMSKVVNWRGIRGVASLFDRQAELYRPLIAAARRQSGPRLCGGIVQPYVDSLIDLRVPNDDGAGGKHGDGRRPLREPELVALLFEFLGAGTGSVVACVEWATAHLVDQPEVQSKLRREILDDGGSKSLRSMPYLNAVVLECLRMHPPVPFTLRGAHGERARAAGVTTMPADDLRVFFDLGSIGRDKKCWTHPDEFWPERFLAGGEAELVGPTPGQKGLLRIMPFGAGHRHCPGVGMGMMLIKCFLAALVREFEWGASEEDRTAGGGIDMTELNGFLKMMKKPLLARVTPRTLSVSAA